MLIYVVDDNPDICEFIAAILGEIGYTVLTFLDPVSALGHMQSRQPPPSVLITDYNLPKMNGYELYRKTVEYAPDVKTIVISGRPVSDRIGELHFLQKPFNHNHLVNLITALKP